jgi:hypothetical protein
MVAREQLGYQVLQKNKGRRIRRIMEKDKNTEPKKEFSYKLNPIPGEFIVLEEKVKALYPKMRKKEIYEKCLIDGARKILASDEQGRTTAILEGLAKELNTYKIQVRDMEATLQNVLQIDKVLFNICCSLFNIKEYELEGELKEAFRLGLYGEVPMVYEEVLNGLKLISKRTKQTKASVNQR